MRLWGRKREESPPGRSCPGEKGPRGSLPCPRSGCRPSLFLFPQTLRGRGNDAYWWVHVKADVYPLLKRSWHWAITSRWWTGGEGLDLTHSACDPSLRTVALHWRTCAGRRWRQDSAAGETAESTSEGQHLTITYHLNLFLNFNIWRLSQAICIERRLKQTIFCCLNIIWLILCSVCSERKSKHSLVSCLCFWIRGETFSIGRCSRSQFGYFLSLPQWLQLG